MEKTKEMLEQLERATALSENLNEAGVLDILDALAVAGYTLEKIESNNHASDMYIALLMENSQVS
jgi:isopentenyl diphosphate isomerase/L-lactate dehydrogenase-like FMN-dependent dehydrogenase